MSKLFEPTDIEKGAQAHYEARRHPRNDPPWEQADNTERRHSFMLAQAVLDATEGRVPHICHHEAALKQAEVKVRELEARIRELEEELREPNDNPALGKVSGDWVWRCEHNVKRAEAAEARVGELERDLALLKDRAAYDRTRAKDAEARVIGRERQGAPRGRSELHHHL
jgi:hypothetical protein